MPHLAIVVMGVCGSGKTTIGEKIGAKIDGVFLDGDNIHSAQNIQKMRSGVALNDEDRLAWLLTLSNQIQKNVKISNVVIGCSALKIKYRKILRGLASNYESETNNLDQLISVNLVEEKSYEEICDENLGSKNFDDKSKNHDIVTNADNIEENTKINVNDDDNLANICDDKSISQDVITIINNSEEITKINESLNDNLVNICDDNSVCYICDRKTCKNCEKSPKNLPESYQKIKIVDKISELKNQSPSKSDNENIEVIFLYLRGTETELEERLKFRKGHFMPPNLLKTQLRDLEEPSSGEFQAENLFIGQIRDEPDVIVEKFLRIRNKINLAI